MSEKETPQKTAASTEKTSKWTIEWSITIP